MRIFFCSYIQEKNIKFNISIFFKYTPIENFIIKVMSEFIVLI